MRKQIFIDDGRYLEEIPDEPLCDVLKWDQLDDDCKCDYVMEYLWDTIFKDDGVIYGDYEYTDGDFEVHKMEGKDQFWIEEFWEKEGENGYYVKNIPDFTIVVE